MKWLVENGASLSSACSVKDFALFNNECTTYIFLFIQSGFTPLINACNSDIDLSSKVRYLGDKGADCSAKDCVSLVILLAQCSQCRFI